MNTRLETGYRLAGSEANVPRRKGRRKGRRPFAGSVIVVCALVAVLVAADQWSNSGEIHRGVSAGSVALGGKTPAEATRLLEDRGAPGEVRLAGPEDVVLDAEKLGAELDAAKTAERAYAVGRSGGLLERVGGRTRAAFGAARVDAAVDYRPGAVRAAVENVAGRVNREPRAAAVAIRGAQAEVLRSENGYELDAPATAENVRRAVEGLDGEAPMAGEVLEPKVATPEAERAAAEARRAMSAAVVLTSGEGRWELSPVEIGRSLRFVPENGEMRVVVDREKLKANLADTYTALTVEPVEAGYRVEDAASPAATPRVSVTPGREGRSIEEEKLLGTLEDGIFAGQREYEVPVAVDEPELTTAEAEGMKPTRMLGSYRTNYSIVPDDGARVENLKISSNAVSGTLLAPGETYSMNDTVSDLDYNATKVIVDGEETLADGGGLCQVTSTLYNAVMEAGLDVTERSPHYAQLPYIRPGLDATVWFGDEYGNGALDMQFENTSEGYVLLREYVADDGYIYAEVWGVPDNVEVRTWSEPVYRGRDSAQWITYQSYTEGDKVVYDGVLHKDTYQALEDKKGKLIPADVVPIAPVEP